MKKMCTVILTIIMVLALVTGCSSSSPSPASTSQVETTSAVAEAPVLTTAEVSTETVATVLDEVTDAAGILELMEGSMVVMKNGLSYDYVMTVEDQVINYHFSFKGENERFDMLDPENPSLMITKDDVLYIINLKEKTGFMMAAESDIEGNPADDTNLEEDMDQDSLTIVGKEDVNGESCYVVTTKSIVDGYDMKMWLHQKYGIIMKMESQSEEGKVFIEVKNLKVGDVPDSDFEIPEDITMMEMPG